ncbi:PREDICTED: CTL-like protein 2 [Rhagoletis zephyria]|uniref:CTL-like protein 2 n=1 Tax=Rhagoletis zephyria TaxID=28612 RepID=UPI0008118365|nr:PREDICTED: CTL-like protein 2 [Rhagoletis zephyria]XP_017472270.1 PREDICTED: CTL-like protein 2 [Rhagoletis zephyria]XP_017472271.1 PREDICTED: CTL-like protein 2 [Rhagoletis zephyria]XP_017472272.1 PREDICTED: CTL-like protein 2 [Rhagoletis zephyria]XP_017472274.1 PREDICTED: CTL-like protein 2 [Rhagoletis zephyria]XP_017472275.1 PREDICTED: CTL-like protein 2 [Rhagoletis zephyria]
MAEDRELIEKYGKPVPYDRNFRGPEWRNRSCTDVPCLLIFIIFLAGWGFIAQYAVRNGDLNKLVVPTDSFNRKCGIDSSVLDKKYLFFFDLGKCIDPVVPLTGCPTQQVCVESCPTQTFIWDRLKDRLSFPELKERLICLTEADKNNLRDINGIQRAIDNERCARWYMKSAPFLNRCMWEFSPQMCELIPSFLLPRSRRASNGSQSASLANGGMSGLIDALIDDNSSLSEVKMEVLALTAIPEPAVRTKQELVEEPAIQCRRRTEQAETIKQKVRQADTRLAKLVGNMVAHFYNGTHDAQQLGEEIVEDIMNSWYVVLMALMCTLIASLILIALMRWFAAPILWLSIFGVLVGLGFGIYYCVKQYRFWRETATVPNHSLNLEAAVKNVLQEPSTWLYLSIFLAISFVVILLLVIVLRSRIQIAIALTKEGSKAVSSIISTVFFPIFSWVLFILAVTYAIGVGLYLGSIGEPSFRMIRQLDANSLTSVTNENCVCTGPAIEYKVGGRCDPKIFEQNCFNADFGQRSPCTRTTCSFAEIEHPPFVTWSIVYNVFGFFWLTFFIAAFSDMVLALTFATWYWTFKKRDVPFFTLGRAFRQTIFYHLGTLAFGSLILAVCRMIRIALEYLHSKLIKYDNAVTRAILCCMRCFFWLLENFLRFLNRNAYIMCAIHGKNFCASAKDAFNLIMRNFLRVIAVDKVTDFLFFLSKVLLTGAAGVGTYYFVVRSPHLIQLHYNAVPVTLVVIAAFIMTTVFFGVYSMAVDTLFLCFLEDCERNDGSSEKPFFMSKQLMRILGKRNKFPRQRSI